MGPSTTTSADQASEKATGKRRGEGNVISNALPQQRSYQRSISVQFLLASTNTQAGTAVEKLSSALSEVVLLAAVPALGATAAAGPLARVRCRVLEYLHVPPAVRVGQRGSEKQQLFFFKAGRCEDSENRGREEANSHLAERVVLVLESGDALLELGIADLEVLGLRLQLRHVRLLPLPGLLRRHAVPQQPLEPVLLLVPRGAAALLPRRWGRRLAILLGALVRACCARRRRRADANLRHAPYLLVALRPCDARDLTCMRQLSELQNSTTEEREIGVVAGQHLPPSLRLLGAELEERSLLVGSELVALFVCCFSCSCAAILLSPLQSTDQDLLPPATTPPSDSASSRGKKIKSLNTPHARMDNEQQGREKNRCRSDETEKARGERECLCAGHGEMVVGGLGVLFLVGRHPRCARHRHPTVETTGAWRAAAPYTPPPHLTETS
jgi:hypothetical protein